MRRRRDRQIETAGLSFLDCICCGFGAIVLLLVITKVREPATQAEATLQLVADALRLQEQQQALASQLLETRHEADRRSREVARKRTLREKLRAQLAARSEDSASPPEAPKAPLLPDIDPSSVLGLPADSEYVIFVLDTSGSMKRFNWDFAIRKISQVLDVYPKIRGFQVLNDMGAHMFASTRGKWLPDTRAGRRRIRDYIRNWSALSNSNPVEGIEAAIRIYHSRDKTISIYVFGDEFTGDSVQRVVDSVDRLNRSDGRGRRRVRIHAIGFPLIDPDTGKLFKTGKRFASLMRALCDRNGGTFIALQPG